VAPIVFSEDGPTSETTMGATSQNEAINKNLSPCDLAQCVQHHLVRDEASDVGTVGDVVLVHERVLGCSFGSVRYSAPTLKVRLHFSFSPHTFLFIKNV
jgi:hypothetical protein